MGSVFFVFMIFFHDLAKKIQQSKRVAFYFFILCLSGMTQFVIHHGRKNRTKQNDVTLTNLLVKKIYRNENIQNIGS